MLILVTNFIDFLYLSPSTLLLSLILSKSRSSLYVQWLNVQYRGKTFKKKEWESFYFYELSADFSVSETLGD